MIDVNIAIFIFLSFVAGYALGEHMMRDGKR